MTAAPNMPDNPDTRPLPDGWVQEYDGGRQKWFYKQTSRNPPRISYLHPLGALKSVSPKVPSPILNIRGQTQRASSGPEVPSPSETESYVQQLYKHAAVPGVITPAANGQPNLPARMRQTLSRPPTVAIPTTPIRSEHMPLGKRMSLGGSATPSTPLSTGSSPASGLRAFYTSLQLPSPPNTGSSPNSATSLLSDPIRHGSNHPLPPLPGQATPPKRMQPTPPTSPPQGRPLSLQPGADEATCVSSPPVSSPVPPADHTSSAPRSLHFPIGYDISPLSTIAPTNQVPASSSQPLVQHSILRSTSTSPSQSAFARIPFAPPSPSPPPPPPPLHQRPVQDQRGMHLPGPPPGHVQPNQNPQYYQVNQYPSHQQPQPYQQPQPSGPSPDYQLTQYHVTQYQPEQVQPAQYQPAQYQPTQYQPAQSAQYQPTQYQPTQPAQYQPTQYEPKQPVEYQPAQQSAQHGPPHYQSPQSASQPLPPQQRERAAAAGPGLMNVLKTGYKVYKQIDKMANGHSSHGAGSSSHHGGEGSGYVDPASGYGGDSTNGQTDSSGFYQGGGDDNTFSFSGAWSDPTGGGSGSGDTGDPGMLSAFQNLGQSGSDGNGPTDAFSSFMQNGDGGGGFGDDNAPPYDPGF